MAVLYGNPLTWPYCMGTHLAVLYGNPLGRTVWEPTWPYCMGTHLAVLYGNPLSRPVWEPTKSVMVIFSMEWAITIHQNHDNINMELDDSVVKIN